MGEEELQKIYNVLDIMQGNGKSKRKIDMIREMLNNGEYQAAILEIRKLRDEETKEENKEEAGEDNQVNNDNNVDDTIEKDEENNENNEDENTDNEETEENDKVSVYPKELQNKELERTYIGMLLANPQAISMYYFLHDEVAFDEEILLNIYKSILFTEGQAYAPEIAKQNFNFAKDTFESNELKRKLKLKIEKQPVDTEKVYIELKKLFVLRRNYERIPIQELKDVVKDIVNYELYDKMTVEEVDSAVEQVCATSKFKKAILNDDLTGFLLRGDNSLTNGLAMPFPILTSVFKGMRKGETMAFAMPSNAGKSRFTINLASQVAFVHKKKVLIISNEMSEEKMRLCLITTILNNPAIQDLHGQKISKTEGELLEFKFRPDDPKTVKVDEDGFVLKEEKETQEQFVKRLKKVSTEFNQTVTATDWLNKEINNSIYFANITDHTNDELKKIIMNYYYKEQIEYVFYDTMKTDTANIGIGEELKKTATILSNIAQNFNIFIGATLQLSETETLPINLTINDLAVSRTVKEVLDTLCLIKQIHRDNLDDYEYSLEEVDTKFFDLEKFKDPDVRYYACVVDKNRAGAKPKVLFRLNLAYNIWNELGYLRLKQDKK